MSRAALNVSPRGNNVDGIDRILSWPRARVYRNAGLSIATGLGTILIWDSLEYDTGGMWDPLNPTRLYCRVAGEYRVQGDAEWPSAGGLGHRRIRIMKNGTTLYNNNDLTANSTGLTDPQTVSDAVVMNAGDYVELLVVQDSGVLLPFNGATLTNRVNGLQACLQSLL